MPEGRFLLSFLLSLARVSCATAAPHVLMRARKRNQTRFKLPRVERKAQGTAGVEKRKVDHQFIPGSEMEKISS
jgi:hypothetical protein